MLNENLEFDFAPIAFKLELSEKSKVLHEEAVFRAKKYLIAEAELLEAIIQIDKDKTYEKFGLTHLTPYCVKELKLSEDVAANFIRVARKTLVVPELRTAVAEGLSITKAKAISSIVTKENGTEWISKAKTLSKEKLEQAVAEFSPKAAQKEKLKPQGLNRVRMELDLTTEEAELFRRAQELVSQKLRKSATLAETQAELLKTYLKKKDPVAKAHRSRDRPARKKLPAHILHAVHARDEGRCQAQLPDGTKCGSRKWIHLHHIVPLAQGGANEKENLTTLCASHHRLWHRD